ncbi:MAG: hypothetical protein ACK5QC_00675 [Bacteroidota bacterium]|jgi:hypothetical protein
MSKHVKNYSDFIKEAAEWDDPKKKRIDGYFVSFDPKEEYELNYFINDVQEIIKKMTGKTEDKALIHKVATDCKDKIAHNNPRKQLMDCVLAYFDIELPR